MGWNWRKGISVGKKVLAAGFVMASAPFLVPPLFVASTIALIASLPYCFFLASYVCTEKLMGKLLPATAFGGRTEKTVLVVMSEPVFVQTVEEDRTPLRVTNIVFDVHQTPEDMRKESKSLLESIRDDGSANQSLDRGISEKAFGEDKKEWMVSSDAKSDKVEAGAEDLSRKKKVSGTKHEGKRESTTTKVKDMETSSNEMKVLYNEEQIWAKMETLRKIVGYSVARSTTYSEELKALFMFMGVEFPTSMLEKEDQDIALVSERLCFLMSVIGIK